MTDRLNLNLSGTTFADEQHASVGSAAFELEHDWFTQQDLVIRTAAAGGGTLLVLGADYVLSQESVDDAAKGVTGLSTRSGKNVFHKVQVINAGYQTGTLYFSGKYIGDSIDADDYNYLLSRMRPRGHLFGLTLSNNGTDPTNDIDVAAGEAVDNSDGELMVLSSSMTKQLDAAWAAGSNAGGRDTGAIADGWWAVWLIKNLATGVVDVLFSLSATSPTMPTGYTKKRRIGWIRRSSGAILAFKQTGDRLLWKAMIQDRAPAAPGGTARTAMTLSAPPDSIAVVAVVATAASGAGDVYIWIRPTWYNDVAASASVHNLFLPTITVGGGKADVSLEMQLEVDSSSQVAFRASANVGSFGVQTLGFMDSMGRSA
jgi:hypothetical protein